MVMMLPFLLGTIGVFCVFAKRRRTAIAVWVLMQIILLAWLFHHATDPLKLAF